jgi:hypothetical protein
LPDFHRSPLNVITNCYKEGTIPSLPIESKLWRKGRFETIQNNHTPGNDANLFSPCFNHQKSMPLLSKCGRESQTKTKLKTTEENVQTMRSDKSIFSIILPTITYSNNLKTGVVDCYR